MTHRERAVTCPRCNQPLQRKGIDERWRCQSCRGAAMSSRELAAAIREIAPDVAPDDPVLVVEIERAASESLGCPRCGEPMIAIAFGPIAIDRCPNDETWWFDDWEHVTILAAAREPDHRPWLARLLRRIIPPVE